MPSNCPPATRNSSGSSKPASACRQSGPPLPSTGNLFSYIGRWAGIYAWSNLSSFARTLQKGQLITLEGKIKYREVSEEVEGVMFKHSIAEIHATSMKRLSKSKPRTTRRTVRARTTAKVQKEPGDNLSNEEAEVASTSKRGPAPPALMSAKAVASVRVRSSVSDWLFSWTFRFATSLSRNLEDRGFLRCTWSTR